MFPSSPSLGFCALDYPLLFLMTSLGQTLTKNIIAAIDMMLHQLIRVTPDAFE